MKNIERKKLVIIALAILVVCAIIVVGWFAPLQKSKNVIIVSETSVSQGAENNTEMESIKVHETFWNEGNLVAKNLTGTVIFTDAAHNKVVSKNIPISGDLLPDKGLLMTFDSEYTRERTVPKTDVNITILYNWIEDGQSKNYSLLVYSGSYSVTIVTTQINQTSIMLGESVNDTASLTAFGGYNATGTVTFQVKTPAADWSTYDTQILTNGMVAPVSYTPEAGTGTYYFRANYSGDANYIGNQSDAEQLTVTNRRNN